MGRVLDRYPLEIVEVVLEATVTLKIRRMMGAVLKARFSVFPASLSEAQTVAETDSTMATEEMRSSGLNRAAAAVRSLLASAENVHSWSHACLEHLIRKSMELRPSTLIKNGSGYTRREEFENAEFLKKDYVPQDTGPASWSEELRIMLSFWQLQFFLELQGAGHKGSLDTNWSRQDVDVLSQSSADGFYDVSNCVREQILTASDFLGAVTSGTIAPVGAVQDNAYSLPAIPCVEEAASKCRCTEAFEEERINSYRNWAPGHGSIESQGLWGYSFYCAMSSLDGWLDGYRLTLCYPFQFWRKYGFAIWDDKRMVDLGMKHPTHKSFMRASFFYSFRWWSLLTEEELSQEFSLREQGLR
ncbi:uncharacterized protein J4E84_007379 [Alternaria hordeiaustralica]|uniref:uncharacterized protein n=1 Tax=Alternaria hordeiaustralica TaxID=1187925 RepID=UPI0020C4BCBC|nr:uncharacterized protein J4E84_007379 [Alternaria hordeiaustralica]KAI4681783.1 hypothetical protein J4E84_007379 [Alternaria hordeiaustralica]